MVANASCAGGIGGWPLATSPYRLANSSWKVASNSSRRCSRKKMNSLARLIRLMMDCSAADNSTGDRHALGPHDSHALSLTPTEDAIRKRHHKHHRDYMSDSLAHPGDAPSLRAGSLD